MTKYLQNYISGKTCIQGKISPVKICMRKIYPKKNVYIMITSNCVDKIKVH